VEAVTASLAHEVKQPLAAITANSGAALRFFAVMHTIGIAGKV